MKNLLKGVLLCFLCLGSYQSQAQDLSEIKSLLNNFSGLNLSAEQSKQLSSLNSNFVDEVVSTLKTKDSKSEKKSALKGLFEKRDNKVKGLFSESTYKNYKKKLKKSKRKAKWALRKALVGSVL